MRDRKRKTPERSGAQRLTLRQLQTFVAVARAGSTTAAAQAIALSQSATSASLNELEDLHRELRPKSSLQSAIGMKEPRITQKSQGFMGGSFNTHEFFHGVGARGCGRSRPPSSHSAS